jgi:long-chain acyl-CoA synthetase
MGAAMNIAQNLQRASRHFPSHPAILFEGQSLTYAQFQSLVERAAQGLTALHVNPGDRVALFLTNIPAFPITYLAVQTVGAIAVSVNTMLTPDELHHVLSDSGAQTVFTTADLLPQLQPLLNVDVAPARVILCEGRVTGHPVLDELGTETAGACIPCDMDRDDPAAILYTAGTTGRQKGAVLSHGNIVSNM